MCHGSCLSCTSSSSSYSECLTCTSPRYLFFNSCQCPTDYAQNDDFTCSKYDSWLDILFFATYIGLLVVVPLIFLSLLGKISIPVTRKLIDMCQIIGLLYYFDEYYESRVSFTMQLFQMLNFSTLAPNFVGNYFYGKSIDPSSSSSHEYLNMTEDSQNPSLKFLLNGKTANFWINQVQVGVAWLAGFIGYLIFGQLLSLFSKNSKGCFNYILDNFFNFIFLIFYLTFQESCLHMFLGFNQINWDSAINYTSIAGLGLFIILSLFLIYNLWKQKNKYPLDLDQQRSEQINRNIYLNFLFVLDGLAKDESNLHQEGFISIINKNWLAISMIQKIILTALIVFLKVSFIKYIFIGVIAVFAGVFILTFSKQNLYQFGLYLLADIYTIIIIVFITDSMVFYILLPGIYVLIGFMVFEALSSRKIYPQQFDENIIIPTRKVIPIGSSQEPGQDYKIHQEGSQGQQRDKLLLHQTSQEQKNQNNNFSFQDKKLSQQQSQQQNNDNSLDITRHNQDGSIIGQEQSFLAGGGGGHEEQTISNQEQSLYGAETSTIILKHNNNNNYQKHSNDDNLVQDEQNQILKHTQTSEIFQYPDDNRHKRLLKRPQDYEKSNSSEEIQIHGDNMFYGNYQNIYSRDSLKRNKALKERMFGEDNQEIGMNNNNKKDKVANNNYVNGKVDKRDRQNGHNYGINNDRNIIKNNNNIVVSRDALNYARQNSTQSQINRELQELWRFKE